MLKLENKQLDFDDMLLEEIVSQDHPYRKIKTMINFEKLLEPLHEIYSKKGRKGIALESGFKCLLIQYWEDLSDRQLERYVRENMAMRWFCGYKLTERTPDHSFYGKLRKRIGLERLSELFNKIIKNLEDQGYVGNIFHFVDSSSLISKVNLWAARDKAMMDKKNKEKDEKGNKKMNNKNISKYSSDKEARFGCKGNKKFWFGYKRHNRVDMRQGIITKVEVTDASVPDSKVFVEKDLCPEMGMVFMDKGYDTEAVYKKLEEKKCKSGVIKKINRKDKNKDLDKWLVKVRMHYENVFKGQSKIARYRGILKVKFQCIFEAIVFNLKRLCKINKELVPII